MAAYAGHAPWYKAVSEKGVRNWRTQDIQADGMSWDLTTGWHKSRPAGWREKVGKKGLKSQKVTYYNKNGEAKTVTMYGAKDYDDYIGFHPPFDHDEDALEYAEKALSGEQGQVVEQKGVGHIGNLRYAVAQQVLEVTFNDKGGGTCIFWRVPSAVAGTLISLAKSGATIQRSEGRKSVTRHLLGVQFWDLVRIRGQVTGARYPFDYSQDNPRILTSTGRPAGPDGLFTVVVSDARLKEKMLGDRYSRNPDFYKDGVKVLLPIKQSEFDYYNELGTALTKYAETFNTSGNEQITAAGASRDDDAEFAYIDEQGNRIKAGKGKRVEWVPLDRLTRASDSELLKEDDSTDTVTRQSNLIEHIAHLIKHTKVLTEAEKDEWAELNKKVYAYNLKRREDAKAELEKFFETQDAISRVEIEALQRAGYPLDTRENVKRFITEFGLSGMYDKRRNVLEQLGPSKALTNLANKEDYQLGKTHRDAFGSDEEYVRYLYLQNRLWGGKHTDALGTRNVHGVHSTNMQQVTSWLHAARVVWTGDKLNNAINMIPDDVAHHAQKVAYSKLMRIKDPNAMLKWLKENGPDPEHPNQKYAKSWDVLE